MNTDSFISIDDDEGSNVLFSIIIRHALGRNRSVYAFSSGQEGIAHLLDPDNAPQPGTKHVLFLDINMPKMDGWAVLDAIAKEKSQIGENLQIFMLSSSIDPRDRERALQHPLVYDFIEKPLTVEVMQDLFSD